MKTPVDSLTARAFVSSFAGVDRRHLLHTQLAEDAPVELTGERAERRRRADDRHTSVRATGERHETAQDDALTDLVLGAADDDDVPFGHRLSEPRVTTFGEGYRARNGTGRGAAAAHVSLLSRGSATPMPALVTTGAPRPLHQERRSLRTRSSTTCRPVGRLKVTAEHVHSALPTGSR
jgi:hypothetical protein